MRASKNDGEQRDSERREDVTCRNLGICGALPSVGRPPRSGTAPINTFCTDDGVTCDPALVLRATSKSEKSQRQRDTDTDKEIQREVSKAKFGYTQRERERIPDRANKISRELT